LLGGEDVPDRLGQLGSELDLRDLGPALAAKAAFGAPVALLGERMRRNGDRGLQQPPAQVSGTARLDTGRAARCWLPCRSTHRAISPSMAEQVRRRRFTARARCRALRKRHQGCWHVPGIRQALARRVRDRRAARMRYGEHHVERCSARRSAALGRVRWRAWAADTDRVPWFSPCSPASALTMPLGRGGGTFNTWVRCRAATLNRRARCVRCR
jgi:hypothetical protein